MNYRFQLKLISTCALALTLAVGIAQPQGKGGGAKGKGKGGPGLTLTTTAFEDGGIIPDKYTSQVGADAVSPELTWSNVPDGTQSFVLHMHDPDVAIGGNTDDVLHWMVINIPGTRTSLPEGVPADPVQIAGGGMQLPSIGGTPGYRGPGAPAAGPPHHYTFELYALDTMLDLPAEASREDVMAAMQGHIRGKGVLMGRFIRH